jgi:hypothetical protein
MDKESKEFYQRQLIRLGDMMGDGEHHEPGGKWIAREYRKTMVALGIVPKKKRPNRTPKIDEQMQRRVSEVKCGKCGGELKQTRSGSKRATCQGCDAKWQLLK